MPEGPRLRKNTAVFFAVAALVVAVDQFTKALVIRSLYEGEVIRVIPGFFNLVHFRNTGAAFGILRGPTGVKTIVLGAVTLLAVVFIFLMTMRTRSTVTAVSLSLVAGGALGNLIDRIRFGAVVDFLDLYLGPWHWPAFNVADSAITCGVFASLILIYTRGGS